jgi:F-type H+-transporting ATPase subunit gamma
MEDIERIRERLDNIQSVEPIITSLRTIAAGGWRQALRRREGSEGYSRYLGEVMSATLPHLSHRELARLQIHQEDSAPPRRALMLVIASQRGLGGAYNDIVYRGAEQILDRQRMQSEEVLLATLGARATIAFRRAGSEPYVSWDLPVTRVAPLDLVRDLGQELRSILAEDRADSIYVVYSPYRAATTEPPVAERWLPVERSMLPGEAASWPEPFIETDPSRLFHRALEEWTLSRLYRIIMEAAASEQAARYRAMDAASTNLERVIGELTLEYHTARQHAITMEMLDLAAGAGSLSGPEGSATEQM